MRDLSNVKQLVDKLTPGQQLELAEYLAAKSKRKGVGEEALLSEAVLAKDWLRPEEDRAWASL